MEKEAAIKFFAEFYYGSHHIPEPIKPYGEGWYVKHYADLSSYDFNGLNRLVLMAHKYAVRVEIRGNSSKDVKICIWQRKREGDMSYRHPTIEEAIDRFLNALVKS